jgi:5-methylcytosine-specific restriction protein B
LGFEIFGRAAVREAEFKEWLARRKYKGELLSQTTNQNRIGWLRRLERALPALGFHEGDLDQVHAAGHWDEMYEAITRLMKNWRANEQAAQVLAPQTDDPTAQISNTHGAARLYGYFADGKDPSFSAGRADEGLVSSSRPFLLFDAAGAAFKPVLNHNRSTDRSAYRVKPAGASNKADDAVELDTIEEVARAMLVSGLPARVQSVNGGPVNYLGYGKQKLVRYELDPAIAARIGVPPRGSVEQAVSSGTEAVTPPQESHAMSEPTNLILYGPPGTGKTYNTAAEAVKLCDRLDGRDPLLTDASRRIELRQRYDQLVNAGQIRLVTFHQSYSYEDFVEGLRPVTDAPTEGEPGTQGAGFRLEPKRGIFREICAVAEEARKNVGRGGGFELDGRKVFKMSLGRSGEEDYIFDAAIEGGYVVLGWGGEVDWSDPRYEEWSAILERWQQEDPSATGSDPNVVQLWPLRSAMRQGDIVIVSAGNSHFRAIGEVTGPYRFEPTETRTYNHRRPVRWLLVPDEPLPVDMIYGKKFMMQSCYQLKDALLKKEALRRLLPGNEAAGDGRPDEFVLIIDEINRANISKVFGELITLIEPDKRLGSGAEALTLQLPYSGEPFGVPANLHIVGTMNTADRSIALLDTALRRRFVFREMAPDLSLLPENVDGVPLRRVLETINDRIEYLIDREHRIGHAFLMGEGGAGRRAIDRTMRDKVIPLLQEYFFEDWGRVAAVLGERAERGGAFLDCRKLADPTANDGDVRYSWSVRAEFSPDAYDRLIGKAAPELAQESPA